MYILLGSLLTSVLLGLYLAHINNAMKQVPAPVAAWSPHRWTDKEIKKTYEKVCKKPLDFTPALPPKLPRRYIIVGGSGLVGGFIVLHLLARGQPAASIRIVDFRAPTRADLKEGKAAEVRFLKAEITSVVSIAAAFSEPWPEEVASLPLTVIHTAATIRPGERAAVFMHRSYKVNVDGTANVMAAAKGAGADVFLATSSASVALRPVQHWIWPWEMMPRGLVQVFEDPEKDIRLRNCSEYFSNYAMTKAIAEEMVCTAHEDKFRTGCIRPACVYGHRCDIAFGYLMDRGRIETWMTHNRQPMVHAEHISLGHLLQEEALLKSPDTVGGKSFVISDPPPPPTFGDMYKVLMVLMGLPMTHIPPIMILLVAHAIEFYCLALAHSDFLRKYLPEPAGKLAFLQPSMMSSSSAHQFASDAPARRPVEEGGLGYESVCTTLEGICDQVRRYNKEIGKL